MSLQPAPNELMKTSKTTSNIGEVNVKANSNFPIPQFIVFQQLTLPLVNPLPKVTPFKKVMTLLNNKLNQTIDFNPLHDKIRNPFLVNKLKGSLGACYGIDKEMFQI